MRSSKGVCWAIILSLFILFILGCVYIYLVADWPIDDSIGRFMTDKDWYEYSMDAAISIFTYGILVALFFLFLSYVVIKISGLKKGNKVFLLWVPLYLLVIIMTSIFAALKVYASKSWM